MAVTVEGMIGRAIMANTPEERQMAEDVSTLLMHGSRMLADWRSVVVIENGPSRIRAFPAREWDKAMSDEAGKALLAEWSASGGRVIDGRKFTADGKLRKDRSAKTERADVDAARDRTAKRRVPTQAQTRFVESELGCESGELDGIL